ncbi:hypothetical protein [uncultured Jannaschia sp.]|uniref:hypothetical protein n=1 Tax=uncultured Jannaschia sp. TaxID=293347 RepID=UPI0026335685|nr:hypothetical protein [uncultured Jannaschia sp.]
MDGLAALWARLRAGWADLPSIPDLPLPHPGDLDVLIVIATVVTMLGIMGVVTAWVDRRVSAKSLLATLVGIALFFWVWEVDRDGFGLIRIPEAFIEMVARVIR